METTQPLFKDVSQSDSFMQLYLGDSGAIFLVGMTVITFVVLQLLLISLAKRHKSLILILLSNIVTAGFAWVSTLYLLYPELIRSLTI